MKRRERDGGTALQARNLVCLEAVAAGVPLAGLVAVGDLVKEVQNPPDFRPAQREAGEVYDLLLELGAERLGQFRFGIGRAEAPSFDCFNTDHRVKTLGNLVLEIRGQKVALIFLRKGLEDLSYSGGVWRRLAAEPAGNVRRISSEPVSEALLRPTLLLNELSE